MRKRLMPLAAVTLILGGCASYSVAQSLIKDGIHSFLVRSITLNVNGTEKANTVLIWGTTGDDKLAKVFRKTGSAPSTSSVTVDPTKNTANDTVNGGSSYTYTAIFNSGKTMERKLTVWSITDPGEVGVVSPKMSGITPATATSARPTFTWTAKGDASGYLLTVGKLPAGQDLSAINGATGLTPVYTAFLDAASHSTSATFGTPSDMAGMTKEMTAMLGTLDARFTQKDTGVADLDTTSTYMWVVSPIKVDADSVSFGIGNQAFSAFKVQ